MDVRNASQIQPESIRQTASRLNRQTGPSTIASAQWNNAMNRARATANQSVAAQDSPNAGINRATANRALSLATDGDLNHRLRTLDGVTSVADAQPVTEKERQLEKTAQTLVNQFFMGSMLKQMRNSPFKDETFSGGKAGDAYAGLFDQRVSEHSGNGIAKGLVRSMVKAYQKQKGPALESGLNGRQGKSQTNQRNANAELLVQPQAGITANGRLDVNDSNARATYDASTITALSA